MTVAIVIHTVAFPSQGPCGVVNGGRMVTFFFFLAFISKESCGD